MKHIIDEASIQRARIIYRFNQAETPILTRARDALELARRHLGMRTFHLDSAAKLLEIITEGVCFGICAKLLDEIEKAAGAQAGTQVLESYETHINKIANLQHGNAAQTELEQANLKLEEIIRLNDVRNKVLNRNLDLLERGLMSPTASRANRQEQLEEEISELMETAAQKLLKAPYIDIDRSKEVLRKDILESQRQYFELKSIMENLDASEREKNTRAICCYRWNMNGAEVGHAIIVDLCLLNEGRILIFDPNEGLAEWKTAAPRRNPNNEEEVDIEFGGNNEPYFESNCIKACAKHCRFMGVGNFHQLDVEMYGAAAHKFSNTVRSSRV